MRRIFLPAMMLLLAVPAVAGSQAVPSTQATSPVIQGDYVIGPEDILDIAVWNNTTISRTVPVRPDGMISLPLLNDVLASGQTPLQLRDELMRKLKEYMPDPEVSVIVQEVHSRTVSVIGSVKKPGRFELRRESTVLDLLALAEGLNEFASPSRIVVLRTVGGVSQRLRFNYKSVTTGNGRDNFVLFPGDIIVVP